MSPWREYLDFAHQLADAAAAVSRPRFRTALSIDDKTGAGDGFDPVTRADREAESAMRALIRGRYPEHRVFGEEHGGAAREIRGDAPGWVLDPIDGTRAFITGLPLWGTLIAFNDGAGPLIGIMDQPFTGERFVGTPEGAWLGERKLATRPCAGLGEGVLYCTDPDMFAHPAERAAFGRVEAQVKMRRFGGDCYAYCMLALGLVDLVIEGDLKPYDIQALIPIIVGAGGVVTSWDGGPADQGGLIIAAGDRRVHAQAMAVLRG